MKGLTGPGCAMIALLVACATPGTQTQAIYEDKNRVVGVQTVHDGNDGKPFSHPAVVSEDDVTRVLRGLYVETRNVSLSGLVGGAAQRQPAFSQREIAFFAPLFVKGLGQARSDEMVTFYETAEISDVHELTTSGGMFLQGDAMHIVLSNYGVKTEIWQDNEQYRPPVRNRPLEPIDPEPGQLVFRPARFMVQSDEGTVAAFVQGKPWHVAVRFREIRE